MRDYTKLALAVFFGLSLVISAVAWPIVFYNFQHHQQENAAQQQKYDADQEAMKLGFERGPVPIQYSVEWVRKEPEAK